MRREKNFSNGWEFCLGKQPGEYQPVHIPHDWAIFAPLSREMRQGAAQGFRDRWGVGWYRKNFLLEEKDSERVYFLEFQGIYENSTVWVNGECAGGRKYGYSTFQLDITCLLREGENEIVVKVDNTAFPADRWYSGAGIYRPVLWIETGKMHLDREEVIITTSLSGDGAGIIRIVPGCSGTVTAVVSDKSGKIMEGRTTDGGEIVLTVPDARLWSPDEPNLYDLHLSLIDGSKELDTLNFQVGIRQFAFHPDKGMLLNEKPIKIKGICIHQDLGCLGTAFSADMWRERLLILKELGCNALRTAHHSFAPEFLDLCDELGFLVYEEAFDKWTGGAYGRYFETEWKRDLDSMVKRDRNHPCVFIWGTGNEVEFQGQESMLKILRMLKEEIVSLDATRPVCYAMNPHFKREKKIELSKVTDIQKMVDETDDLEIYHLEERIERIKKIGEIVDIIGCNYQEQWYEDIHRALPDKLILGTEVYQYFMGHPEQMKNHTAHVPSLVPFEKEYVIGSMIWTGIDYLGESMGYPYKGWCGSLIRTTGDRRPSYYMMKSYWSREPMVHFSVMDYSLQDEGTKEMWDIPFYADHWHFPQFRRAVVPYIIASNCDEVCLFLNGTPFYLPRPSDCPNRLITGFLPWQPGKVEVIGLQNGKEVCRHITVTPGPSAKLSFETPERKVPAQPGYELLLRVRAQDLEGNPCFHESAKVRFRVEGKAQILAVDNGDLSESSSYQDDAVHLYRGCGAVVLRLEEDARRVKVFADAEGLQTAEAVVVVKG